MFNRLTQENLRSLAAACGGVALLMLVALGLGSYTQPGGTTQAAATALGDSQGIPSGYTGRSYPADTYCWVNQSYQSYGANWGPLCPGIGNSYYGNNPNLTDTFTVGVFSADLGGGQGRTIYATRTVTSSGTRSTTSTAQCSYPYTLNYFNDTDYGGHYKCAYWQGDSWAYQQDSQGEPTGQPTCSSGAVLSSDWGTCTYSYHVNPSMSGPTTHTVGAVSLPGGQSLTFEWSCLPSRQVNWEAKYQDHTFGVYQWHSGVIYDYSLASSVSGSGPGFTPSGLTGTEVVTMPSDPGTYNYTLNCNGGSGNMTIPVTVTMPPPSTTISVNGGANGAGATVYTGSSNTITATYAVGSSDDALTATTLTGPNTTDNSLTAQGSPFSPKSYVFTPASAGTYTFYPSLQTTSYPAWNNYGASVTLTVVTQCPNGNGAQGSCTSCDSGYVLQGTAPNNSCQLACPNGSGAAGQCTACDSGYKLSGGNCVLPSGHVTTMLSANPDRVRSGGSTSLTWATEGMTSCTLKDQDGATLSTALSSAGTTVSNITSRQIFTLTCIDNVQTYTNSAVINLVPSVIEI